MIVVPRSRRREREDRRRIVRAFRRAQAVSPATACTASELVLGPLEQARTFTRLQQQEIVRSLAGGRYYLDADRLKDANATAARLGLTFAFVVILIVVVMMVLGK